MSEKISKLLEDTDNYFEKERRKVEQQVSRQISLHDAAISSLNNGKLIEAIEYLLQAVEPTDAVNQYNWGALYYNGIGVPQNYESAFEWFEAAHRQGYANATVALGNMYMLGQYVSMDLNYAFELFKEAAENGDIQAQRAVGVMLLKGEGVERNPKLGYRWIERAAINGDAQAQRNLGIRLLEGDGVTKNTELGYQWIEN